MEASQVLDSCTIEADKLFPCNETEMLQIADYGIDLLCQIFTASDKDNDDILDDTELEEAFAVTPGNPFPANFKSNVEIKQVGDKDGIPLQSWLSLWGMLSLDKPQIILDYVSCWFSDVDFQNIFAKKKKRAYREDENDYPNIIRCFVLGSPISGKSSILRGLINQPFDPKYTKTTTAQVTANTLKIESKDYILVMYEFSEDQVDELVNCDSAMYECDVVCLVYDGNDPYSFQCIAERQKSLLGHAILPAVYVMSKSDLPLEDQKYEISPQDFCSLYNLAWPPVMCSMKTNELGEIYETVATVALNPEIAVPFIEGENDDDSETSTAIIESAGKSIASKPAPSSSFSAVKSILAVGSVAVVSIVI